MFRLYTGDPYKKTYRLIWAILLLLLAYSILQNFIPTIPKTSANSATNQLYIEHVVSSGETLWDIARRYRSDADPREIVWEIREASGCTALVKVGQVVLVPVKP